MVNIYCFFNSYSICNCFICLFYSIYIEVFVESRKCEFYDFFSFLKVGRVKSDLWFKFLLYGILLNFLVFRMV